MSVVLITGATKGIGKATAKLFADAGWDLLLIARSTKLLRDLTDELKHRGVKVFYKTIDLSHSEEIPVGINELLSNGIIPSVVINNAGGAWTGKMMSMPIAKWNWLIQLNLTSVFQVCAATIPAMRKKGGLIINVSSHAARNSFDQWGSYCVSKAALERLTKCIAEEERSFSIRACTLTLGSVNSELWESENVHADFNRQEMLTVDQVASQLLHLAETPSSGVVSDLTFMPAGGAF